MGRRPAVYFLPIQDRHKFIAGDGFFFQQIFGKLVQLIQVVFQNADGLFVGCTDDLHHLFVDLGGGLGTARQGLSLIHI